MKEDSSRTVWQRAMEEEGGGEGWWARTHRPTPQHTGSEAEKVVSES